MNTQPLQIEETGPLSLAWSNPEPVPVNDGKQAVMRVLCNPKPAIINDAVTGKKLQVLSFKWGDRLEVQKPEAIGLSEPKSLEILAYGHDENNELYAITEGPMLKEFRTKATFPETHEVQFVPLPRTVAEHCLVDLKGVFRLRRYQPEVNPVMKQILIDFNDKAA